MKNKPNENVKEALEDGSSGKVFGMQAWGLQFDPQKPGKEEVRHDSICFQHWGGGGGRERQIFGAQ